MTGYGTGPSHPDPLGAEIRRLTSLRDQVWSDAVEIDQLGLDGWGGTASDRFYEFRYELVKRWRKIGDLCDSGIQALCDYRDSLVDARDQMPADGRPEDLWAEANPAAEAVARRLRPLNAELASLRSLFDTKTDSAPRLQNIPPPIPGSVPSERPARPIEATLGHPGDSSYSQDTEDVSQQLLEADYHEIDVQLD